MAPRKDIAATATYGAHEVTTPENKLRNAVSLRRPVRGEKDPILRTERAPSALSPQFESWLIPNGIDSTRPAATSAKTA